MYSSATRSSSASGLSAAVGDGEDFGEGEEAGEGEEDESDEGGVEDFRLGAGEVIGVAGGVGEAFCNGLTGPVGFRGVEGVNRGLGEGDGAACAQKQQNRPAQKRITEPRSLRFFMSTAHPNEEVASFKRQRRKADRRRFRQEAVGEEGDSG